MEKLYSLYCYYKVLKGCLVYHHSLNQFRIIVIVSLKQKIAHRKDIRNTVFKKMKIENVYRYYCSKLSQMFHLEITNVRISLKLPLKFLVGRVRVGHVNIFFAGKWFDK